MVHITAQWFTRMPAPGCLLKWWPLFFLSLDSDREFTSAVGMTNCSFSLMVIVAGGDLKSGVAQQEELGSSHVWRTASMYDGLRSNCVSSTNGFNSQITLNILFKVVKKKQYLTTVYILPQEDLSQFTDLFIMPPKWDGLNRIYCCQFLLFVSQRQLSDYFMFMNP